MGEHKLIMGKDIYFWNFIVLMIFTLFEVGAVFFDEVPGTDIAIPLTAVWTILIVVGIVKFHQCIQWPSGFGQKRKTGVSKYTG